MNNVMAELYVQESFENQLALFSFCFQSYQNAMEISAANLQLLSSYLQKTLSSDHAERRAGIKAVLKNCYSCN